MSRIRGNKKVKKRIILFCEGKTEKVYFDCLKQRVRLSNLAIKTIELTNSGSDWIEKSLNKIKNDKNFSMNKTDVIYVIFDKDDYDEKSIELLFKKASEKNMKIGFSNACFEVWLLSHFEKMNKAFINKNQLNRKLSDHLNTPYKKADIQQIERIVTCYEKAIQNSNDIREIAINEQCTNIGEMMRTMKNN